MGHVDHGKTKLLDAIRSANVAEGEAGGITQHIGAYQVDAQGRKITFLDTPGHEAFTAMRARGAQATDVAVLVVAADDGVMPTTREAVAHIKSAQVPMVVAINKIDLPAANPDRVKQQLSEMEVMPEEWGGDVPFVEVSAWEKLGLEDLLEVILLVADVHELKANPLKPASGVVIEAKIDRTRGPVATLLVQSGTLNPRDVVVAGGTWGRVKAMFDDRGRTIRRAEPSMPVEILGLLEVPAGRRSVHGLHRREAGPRGCRAAHRGAPCRVAVGDRSFKLTEFSKEVSEGGVAELRVILKADVSGSLGRHPDGAAQAQRGGPGRGPAQHHLRRHRRHRRVGRQPGHGDHPRSSSASTCGPMSPPSGGRRLRRRYPLLQHHLQPAGRGEGGHDRSPGAVFQDVTDGYAEVRETFKLPGGDMVAGLYVLDGRITRNSRTRVLRSGTVVHEGR